MANPAMDNFLQLVPMEGAEPSLVYGDDDLVVGAETSAVDLEAHIRRHLAQSGQTEALFGDQLDHGGEAVGGAPSGADGDETERQRYLQRIRAIEERMQEADSEVQQRIDTMARILELKDPMEQLSEYLALLLEARQESDAEIVSELLQCATRMSSKEDSEVALLGAFFFLGDRPRAQSRGLTAMLPVVAAMMEASNGFDEHQPF
ncbi:hypothetical protein BBJ28_00014583 [Nothophytophthora sp. Chile5]|nr:hypothetical protein BBJ28_00014583 [Nothophytophthora sp. Chile5]